MSQVLNLDLLCPWDLAISFGGKSYMTAKPRWADVIELGRIERQFKSAQAASSDEKQAAAMGELEGRLRSGVKLFLASELHSVADGMDYSDLAATFVCCSQYFSDWFKKKQDLARAAAGA